jgi:hypothetical protein
MSTPQPNSTKNDEHTEIVGETSGQMKDKAHLWALDKCHWDSPKKISVSISFDHTPIIKSGVFLMWMRNIRPFVTSWLVEDGLLEVDFWSESHEKCNDFLDDIIDITQTKEMCVGLW